MGRDYAGAFYLRRCQYGFGAAFCPRPDIPEPECRQMQRGRFGYPVGNAEPYAQVVVFETGFGVSPAVLVLSDLQLTINLPTPSPSYRFLNAEPSGYFAGSSLHCSIFCTDLGANRLPGGNKQLVPSKPTSFLPTKIGLVQSPSPLPVQSLESMNAGRPMQRE